MNISSQPSNEETLEECKARLQRISEETKAEIKAGKFKPGYVSKKPKDSFTDVDYAELEARVMAREDHFAMAGEAMRFLEMYGGTITGRLTHHKPRIEEIPRVKPYSLSEHGEDLFKVIMHEALLSRVFEMKTAMLGGRGSGKSSMLDGLHRALASESEIIKMITAMVPRKEPAIPIDSIPPGIDPWEAPMIHIPPPILKLKPEASSFDRDEIPPKKRGFAHLNQTPKHPKRGK